jgi:predicted nucleotide-binding protein
MPRRSRRLVSMPKSKTRALVIDDDRFYASYVSNLLSDKCGFDTVQALSPEAALLLLGQTKFHLVIMDLKMPPGRLFEDVDTAGGHTTGFALARAVKKLSDAKIIVHTSSAGADPALQRVTDPSLTVMHKSRNPDDLIRAVRRALAPERVRPEAFIVHGHDLSLAQELSTFLQQQLGFAEPILLSQAPSHGRTLIENFEHYALSVDCAFVLMTPDDVGHVADRPETVQARARQNVIFELGYFYCLMRRQSGRVLVLHKGSLEIPSDLAGLVYVDVSTGIGPAADRICRELAPLLDA